MKLRMTAVVESDDGAVSRTAENGLSLATGIDGVDPSAAKQDFLTQAEALSRMLVENQLPALYQAVEDAKSRAEQDSATQSPAQAAAKAQLDKIRERQNEKQGAQQ